MYMTSLRSERSAPSLRDSDSCLRPKSAYSRLVSTLPERAAQQRQKQSNRYGGNSSNATVRRRTRRRSKSARQRNGGPFAQDALLFWSELAASEGGHAVVRGAGDSDGAGDGDGCTSSMAWRRYMISQRANESAIPAAAVLTKVRVEGRSRGRGRGRGRAQGQRHGQGGAGAGAKAAGDGPLAASSLRLPQSASSLWKRGSADGLQGLARQAGLCRSRFRHPACTSASAAPRAPVSRRSLFELLDDLRHCRMHEDST